ncbi:hypothetical protein [Candidatus Poriferisodalis sp.]|uniref:hypothetical protein n=1 Tax=Candidatus Poriferisodalis sp. TaxID=3101277 RepID=UPI003B51674E
MSRLAAPTGDGHTLLSDEDRGGLLQRDIATRQELFDAEQRYIAALHSADAGDIDDLIRFARS